MRGILEYSNEVRELLRITSLRTFSRIADDSVKFKVRKISYTFAFRADEK